MAPALPGVKLTTYSLTIEDPAVFDEVGFQLALIDTSIQWYWGDYLAYAERNGLKSVLDSRIPDLHRSRIYSYAECAAFYAPGDRKPELSFSHHEAVMYILGERATVPAAKKWLAIAAAKQMTVGEIREAMRQDMRKEEGDPGPRRGAVRLTDFMKISRWAEHTEPADLPAAQVDEIRKTTEPLFLFLCKLHRKSF